MLQILGIFVIDRKASTLFFMEGMSMKKCKRLMSLIMALTMALSVSTYSFAAEKEENVNIEVNEVATGQNEVEPMAANNLITQITGYYTGDKRTTMTIPLTVTGNGSYLYFGILTEGPIVGKLYSNGVLVSRTLISANPKDVQWCQIKLDRSPQYSYWAAGNYTLEVEVMFNYKYSFAIFGTQDELPK